RRRHGRVRELVYELRLPLLVLLERLCITKGDPSRTDSVGVLPKDIPPRGLDRELVVPALAKRRLVRLALHFEPNRLPRHTARPKPARHVQVVRLDDVENVHPLVHRSPLVEHPNPTTYRL